MIKSSSTCLSTLPLLSVGLTLSALSLTERGCRQINGLRREIDFDAKYEFEKVWKDPGIEQ